MIAEDILPEISETKAPAIKFIPSHALLLLFLIFLINTISVITVFHAKRERDSRMQYSLKFTVMKKKNSNTGQSILFDAEQFPIVVKEKFKKEGDYVFDLVDALNAPILTFSQLWADTIPKRMLDLIPMSRMVALMKKSGTATDEECVVYIYTRTLEAPMSSEWTDIYLHLSCHVLEKAFGENHWHELNAPQKLSDWLQSKLTGLRNHIYGKRREILKARLKAQEKDNDIGKKVAELKPSAAIPLTQQASFDF